MVSQVEPVFHKYDLIDLFFDECRKRMIASKPTRLYRCTTTISSNPDVDDFQNRTSPSKPIYFASREYTGILSLHKFTRRWCKYKDIENAGRTGSGWAFHTGKFYVMGGCMPNDCARVVSTI